MKLIPTVEIPLSVTVDIPSTPMNKQEAADYLGVSIRAIERYTKKRQTSASAYGLIGLRVKLRRKSLFNPDT